MATHVASFYCQRSRSASAGNEPGPQPQRSWSAPQILAVTAGASARLNEGTIPIPSWLQRSNERTPGFHFFGQTLGAVVAAIEAGNVDDFWAIDGAYTTNTGIPFRAANVITFGRQSPGMILNASGASLAALTDDTGPTFFRGVSHFSLPAGLDYLSPEQWCDLEDYPPSDVTQSGGRLFELMSTLENPGSTHTLGVTSAGVTRKLQQCTYAAFTPEGRIWLRPEDFGNANEQIPVSVGDNSAAHFRFFPGVFFRRSQYVHALSRVNPDPVAISTENDNSQPFRLTVVDTLPTSSDWVVLVDGAVSVVRVFHGGLDLRRPDEIWDAIWTPFLYASGDVPRILPFGDVVGIQSGVVQELCRLRYAQYFRCIAINASSLTDTPQTDTDRG